MKTETENPKKYNRPATLMQLLRFDPKDSKSFTASPFINAYMKIFCETKADDKDIAEMMELPYRQFSCAFFVETGMTMRDFHNYWVAWNLNVVMDKIKDIDGDELAEKLGYGDRSGLWRFYNSQTYKRIAKELGLRIFPKPEKQLHHGLRGHR